MLQKFNKIKILVKRCVYFIRNMINYTSHKALQNQISLFKSNQCPVLNYIDWEYDF